MKILDCGNDIGLHFDEVRYPDWEGNPQRVVENIQDEIRLLESAVGRTVDVASMHRPIKGLLKAEIEISGVINSYSQTFFKQFKYLSDSRREPVEVGKNALICLGAVATKEVEADMVVAGVPAKPIRKKGDK